MKKISGLLVMFLVTFSCQTATNDVPPGQTTAGNDHFISKEQALQIAQTAAETNPNARSMAGNQPKKVKSQLVIDDADDKTKNTSTQPVFYICNYEEGGYSIISADDRLPSVLALVDKGVGIDKNTKLPGGLLLWMQSTKEQIQNIRKVKLTKKSPKGGRVGTSVVAQVNPLMNTEWDQGCGFNDNVPGYCTEQGTCGHPLTGCVAVAMAQVIRYWGSKNPSFTTPFNYTWSNMPTGTASSSETARLMYDAGREVQMNYGCTSSGSLDDRIPGALKNKFGYSSANRFNSYVPQDVVNSLNNDSPAIISGYTTTNNFLWWTWGAGAGHC